MKWTFPCHCFIRKNRSIEPFEPIDQATRRLLKEGKIQLIKRNGYDIYVLPEENNQKRDESLSAGILINERGNKIRTRLKRRDN